MDMFSGSQQFFAAIFRHQSILNLHAGDDKPPMRCFDTTAALRNVRHVIDCTEFECQTASSPADQSRLWSDYKQHSTIKVLFSANRRGDPNSVGEPCLGGTLSDHHAVTQTGFLEDVSKCKGDVLADKGFKHARPALQGVGVQLYMPSFVSSQSQQLTATQLSISQTLSSARSHIERYNRRLKAYHIFSDLPIKVLPSFDKILFSVVLLTLFMPPLSKSGPQPSEQEEAIMAEDVLTVAAKRVCRGNSNTNNDDEDDDDDRDDEFEDGDDCVAEEDEGDQEILLLIEDEEDPAPLPAPAAEYAAQGSSETGVVDSVEDGSNFVEEERDD
eukprot:m.23929 g.23929  ORF g.23929 m.23929 type:complete len:329 (+) comp9488_c0_seq1:568-1554(+)